jgi:hypothetical protein
LSRQCSTKEGLELVANSLCLDLLALPHVARQLALGEEQKLRLDAGPAARGVYLRGSCAGAVCSVETELSDQPPISGGRGTSVANVRAYTRAASPTTITPTEARQVVTMTALPEVRREFRREQKAVPANFDEWEAWIESDDPQPWFSADPPRAELQPDVSAFHLAARVDRVVGEFFRGRWRRRLADAEGNYGHVARQMRKAGVPLDLALAILLIPEDLLLTAQP